MHRETSGLAAAGGQFGQADQDADECDGGDGSPDQDGEVFGHGIMLRHDRAVSSRHCASMAGVASQTGRDMPARFCS